MVQRLREELSNSDDLIQRLKDEFESVTNRLAVGIEENEALYRRLRELESRSGTTVHTSMREKARSVDSLSDLTNIDFDLDVMQLDKDRLVLQVLILVGKTYAFLCGEEIENKNIEFHIVMTV